MKTQCQLHLSHDIPIVFAGAIISTWDVGSSRTFSSNISTLGEHHVSAARFAMLMIYASNACLSSIPKGITHLGSLIESKVACVAVIQTVPVLLGSQGRKPYL